MTQNRLVGYNRMMELTLSAYSWCGDQTSELDAVLNNELDRSVSALRTGYFRDRRFVMGVLTQRRCVKFWAC